MSLRRIAKRISIRVSKNTSGLHWVRVGNEQVSTKQIEKLQVALDDPDGMFRVPCSTHLGEKLEARGWAEKAGPHLYRITAAGRDLMRRKAASE